MIFALCFLSALLSAALLVLLYLYVGAAKELAVYRSEHDRLKAREADLQEKNTDFAAKIGELSVRLETEQQKSAEKIELLTHAQTELTKTFKALSSDSLKDAQKHFFQLAKETFDGYSSAVQQSMQQKHLQINDLIKPLAESLKAVDGKIHELEKTRISAYATVSEQLKSLAETQGRLQMETIKLVRALRAPSARGRWGEIQLKRVVEMAGMLAYCDFIEQRTFDGEYGRMRPDLIVKLPNGRSIVIDAKSPLQAYLEGLDSENEEVKNAKLKEHAKQLKKHIIELGEKAYWEKLSPTPEFVVLFLPGEAFFSAALEQDPALLEYGVDKKVLIASPTTLIALLRAVAYGWKEELMAEHARAICDLGKSLYDRLKNMTEHLAKLKRSLDGSVESYNKVVASFEARVLPAAKKFEELSVVEQAGFASVDPVEKLTRSLEVSTK